MADFSAFAAYGHTAPKADALPGCATPRTAEALRFPAYLAQVETVIRGNRRRNAAGTGGGNPELFPNGILTEIERLGGGL